MFVKICGITHEEDALLAVALGADALGFNFVPGSTRQVARSGVEAILHRLPPGTLTVGVFRDERPERVVEVVNGLGLGAAQLHGREPVAEVRYVRERVPLVIQAFSAGDPAMAGAASSAADILLVDGEEPGGGRVFDWRLAEWIPSGIPILLAGGLTGDNVGDAIERVRPWGVDVASGVETVVGSGRKDARKLQRFIEEARRAGDELERDGWSPPAPRGGALLYDNGTVGDADADDLDAMRDEPYDWQIEGACSSPESVPAMPAEAADASATAPAPEAPARGGPVRLAPPGAPPTGLGRFGEFGGRFVPESLVPALIELEQEFTTAWGSDEFRAELAGLLADYAGRPTPITECRRLSDRLGVRVLLKREDLTHTGSHKINNVLGQALLTRRMGKQRIIAETGAGQHGVATATAAALFGLDCTVFMGAVDVERQALNVWRMRLLGAEVVPVSSGSATLKDAINEALRDWVASVETTHYCIGSVVGPHPFPWIVRELQRVVGDEAREQCRALLGTAPDIVAACVGGGSNAMGAFAGFLDTDAQLVGVEAAGFGIETGHHGAAVARGVPGILHGSRSLFLQDEDGQIHEAHSISAGLDYPGVGPEHAALAASGRATYVSATDDEALAGFALLAETEGIIPALEPAHAIGWLAREAQRSVPAGATVLVVLSGRGDKDAAQVAERLGQLR